MIKKRLKYLFSRSAFNDLRIHFLQALGVLWLFIEASSFFFKEIGNNKVQLFCAFILAALVWTIWRAFPPLHYSKKSRASNVEIEIKVGDLLKEPCNIAFGCSECFDTDSKKIISPDSLMGQLVINSFGGVHTALDNEISGQVQAPPWQASATTSMAVV